METPLNHRGLNFAGALGNIDAFAETTVRSPPPRNIMIEETGGGSFRWRAMSRTAIANRSRSLWMIAARGCAPIVVTNSARPPRNANVAAAFADGPPADS